jgi:hypothetical protein
MEVLIASSPSLLWLLLPFASKSHLDIRSGDEVAKLSESKKGGTIEMQKINLLQLAKHGGRLVFQF